MSNELTLSETVEGMYLHTEYECPNGTYVYWRDHYHTGGRSGYPSGESIALLIDRGTGRVLKHGEPEAVVGRYLQMLEHYKREITERLAVICCQPDVDALNIGINKKDSGNWFLRREANEEFGA